MTVTKLFTCAEEDDASLFTLVVFRYAIHFSRQWDTPPSESLVNSGRITYRGVPVTVTLICTCPRIVTESIHRSLQFRIDLKPEGLITPPYGNGSAPPTDKVSLSAEAGGATIEPPTFTIGDPQPWLDLKSISQSVVLTVTPTDTTLSQITFHFLSADEGSLGSVDWQINAHSRFLPFIMPFVYGVLVLVLIATVSYWTQRRIRILRERTEKKLADADQQLAANPERIKYAWDVARVKLEAYFDRNLIQVNLVFWVAVVVMIVGFGFVLFGVVLSFNQPKITPTSMVAAVSGIITQFIGATFMVIYRSTMAQANEFMIVLDRINSVGMAVQVLDSIPESEGQLKNATRAQIVELLIAVPSDRSRPRPRKTSSDK